MKKKLLLLSLFIASYSFNGYGVDKNKIIPISNINTDFPISEKLEFKLFNKYDILKTNFCCIDGSILWQFNLDGTNNFGYCYDLKTTKKLSTIIMKGRANYELSTLSGIEFVGDSVQFMTFRNIIKTFSKKDIIDSKPMNKRKFSVIAIPDSICSSAGIKLPNGSVLAKIAPPKQGLPIHEKYEINQKTITVFNKNEAKSYQTLDYDSFGVENESGQQLDMYDKIKMAYAQGDTKIKGNDMAVFSAYRQFMLYTFDINSGDVLKEKRYTKFCNTSGYQTTNDMGGLKISDIQSNDKYILCTVDGYFSQEDKELKIRKQAIFVFDWDLKPIKRFDLPSLPILPSGEDNWYVTAMDCNAVYLCHYSDDGLILSKVDLNI